MIVTRRDGDAEFGCNSFFDFLYGVRSTNAPFKDLLLFRFLILSTLSSLPSRRLSVSYFLFFFFLELPECRFHRARKSGPSTCRYAPPVRGIRGGKKKKERDGNMALLNGIGRGKVRTIPRRGLVTSTLGFR